MFKSGFVSILGRPNVGKSTLLNAIVGEKIASTTEKPQTTREKITGIYNADETQIVFVDTPGLHRPRHKLGEYMMRAAKSAAGEVDVLIYVTDDSFTPERERTHLDILQSSDAYIIIAINKTDKLSLPKFDYIKNYFENLEYVDSILGISASMRRGVDGLVDELISILPEGPKYYPDTMYTDMSERAIVSEIIREKILMYMEQEIPHGVAVSVESFKKRKDKELIDIDAIIICEKESHKGMLIGKNGRKLKGIGQSSRKDIELFLHMKVNLKLWVKVKSGWRDNEAEMKRRGYDFGNVKG